MFRTPASLHPMNVPRQPGLSAKGQKDEKSVQALPDRQAAFARSIEQLLQLPARNRCRTRDLAR